MQAIKTDTAALDYADPSRVKRPGNPNRLLYVAYGCALLPMSVGTGAFVGWLATNSDFFAATGFFTILGGCLLFLVGCALVIGHAWRLWQMRDTTTRRQVLLASLGGLLLISNFPLCGLYLSLVDRTTVQVMNASSQPVTGVLLKTGTGESWPFGTIPPGAQVTRRLLPLSGKGGWTVTATQNGKLLSQLSDVGDDDFPVIGGGTAKVTINPDGTVDVIVRH